MMNPILLDIPERIEGERIYLRSCKPGDGPMVFEAVSASIKELKPWMPWANTAQSEDASEANIRESYAEFILRKDLRLHIMRSSDDVFLGATGLHRIDWNALKFEIGYWVDSRHAKNGYVTEAVNLLSRFAFDELKANRIEIRVDTENKDSRRIPENTGFTLEGILRHDSYNANGTELRSTCVYSKIR
ncbi:GNAT family N-acetyltransferase [Pradoshia sp.]